MKPPTKPTRGGARPGAGRPKTLVVPKVPVMIRITQSALDAIDSLPGTRSEVIEKRFKKNLQSK